MNTTADKLNYLANTKVAIKDAIVAKGVAVSESDTFRSYAGKIGEIQSGGNKIKIDTFTAKTANDDDIKTIIDGIDTQFIKSLNSAFAGDNNLTTFPDADFNSCTKFNSTFQNCKKMVEIGILKTPNVTDFVNAFLGCTTKKIKSIDFDSVTTFGNMFLICDRLAYLRINNIGKSSLETYNFAFGGFTQWGNDSLVQGARQSLIDSLITYSYDRASAGMPTATITLQADVKARLTEEEKAQITAKGFTIA